MSFINNTGLPFCKGCGHTLIAENTEKALVKLGFDPLEVVLVTDIGCHGIIDKSFTTHTVHGLHGRSVALAAGVSVGLNDPSKKVVVFIGDGGSTIGMQHLIDSAHNDFNMTVVIHNNMLYGMTGGQPSEFTPLGFKTPTQPEGAQKSAYNICEIAKAAGASFVSRVMGIGDFSDALAQAFAHKGFSVIEVIEICPSYGMKANPGMKLTKVAEQAGMEMKVFADNESQGFIPSITENKEPLFSADDIIKPTFLHTLSKPVKIMICGSAGEGVQLAAEVLAVAAVKAGLFVTKKSSYPVTVGIGFSTAEVIISPNPIAFTGTVIPDTMIITSEDGMEYGRLAASKMHKGKIILDGSIKPPKTGSKIVPLNFRERMGAKSACLMALFYFVSEEKFFSIDALISAFNENKLSTKIAVERLMNFG